MNRGTRIGLGLASFGAIVWSAPQLVGMFALGDQMLGLQTLSISLPILIAGSVGIAISLLKGCKKQKEVKV